MSVYVDTMLPCIRNANWRYSQSCHLVADSFQELHAFARELGLRRAWFQSKSGLPHYDLTASKRRRAIKLGALPISREELVLIMRRYRQRAVNHK